MRTRRILILCITLWLCFGALPAHADIGGGTGTFDLQASGQIPCPGICSGTLSGSASGALAGLDGLEDWQLVFKDAVATGTWFYTENCDIAMPTNSGSGTVTVSGGIVHGRHGSHTITSFTLTIAYSYVRENVALLVTGSASLTIVESVPFSRQVITNHPVIGMGALVPSLPNYCMSPLRIVGSITILPEDV